MRVISGRAKGRRLKRVPGDSTRPIMDRAKESLFNILGTSVAGQTWLDLFAGTGQVGIEALSRGAAAAVFVDSVRTAIQTIRDNLATTGLADGATVIQTDAFAYLRERMRQPVDVIYIAPPQYQKLWREALLIIDNDPARYLTEEGLAIVQIDPKEVEPLALTGLVLTDERRYGNTWLGFYERLPEATSDYPA
jgi:16S rRNA (guanine(966)-N(2))-methyltransferase RsmD